MDDKRFQAKLAGLDCKTEVRNDVVSRQALIDATVKKNSIWNSITNSKGENLEEIISQLPSATSQPCNDVLDKIRAEIDALLKVYPFVDHYNAYVRVDDVKKIIDKYIESGERE